MMLSLERAAEFLAFRAQQACPADDKLKRSMDRLKAYRFEVHIQHEGCSSLFAILSEPSAFADAFVGAVAFAYSSASASVFASASACSSGLPLPLLRILMIL